MRSSLLGSSVVLGLAGCSEYGLNGPKAPAGHGAAEDDPGSVDTSDSSIDPELDSGEGTVDDPCDDTGSLMPTSSVSPLEVDPDAASPVCTTVGTVDWEMVEKWHVSMPGFVMAPVAAPNQGRPGASVFVDAGGWMIELDGRDGSEVRRKELIADTSTHDDGSTPVVADVDRDGDLDFAAPAWTVTNVVDTGTRSMLTFETSPRGVRMGDDEVIQFADVDLDGSAEVVLSTGVFAADGTVITQQATYQYTQTFVTDLDGDGFPEWVNGTGIWDPRDGSGAAFGTLAEGFYGAPIDAGEGAVAYSGIDRTWSLVRADASVISERREAEGQNYGLVAVGDVDGDGLPDVVHVRSAAGHLEVTGCDRRGLAVLELR